MFANTTLDTPVLPPEIFSIFNMENADIFIDAGGDDVGATALGQLHRQIETARVRDAVRRKPVSRAFHKAGRNASAPSGDRNGIAPESDGNREQSNLAVQTDMQTVLDAVPFAKKAAELCHLPLLYSTVPDFAVENTLPEGFKAVKRYVRFVWEDETE